MRKEEALISENEAFVWYVLQLKRFSWITKFKGKGSSKRRPKSFKIEPLDALGPDVGDFWVIWLTSKFSFILRSANIDNKSEKSGNLRPECRRLYFLREAQRSVRRWLNSAAPSRGTKRAKSKLED